MSNDWDYTPEPEHDVVTKQRWWKLLRSNPNEEMFECRSCSFSIWIANDGIPLPEECPKCAEKKPSALAKQVSGTHYKTLKIQPVEYIHANDLDFFQGNIVKYITRHKDKGGKADVEKAIHFCQMIIELEYGNET